MFVLQFLSLDSELGCLNKVTVHISQHRFNEHVSFGVYSCNKSKPYNIIAKKFNTLTSGNVNNLFHCFLESQSPKQVARCGSRLELNKVVFGQGGQIIVIAKRLCLANCYSSRSIIIHK